MIELILWIDLETTGLDPHVHSVLEVAYILTTAAGYGLSRGCCVIDPIGEPVWSPEAREMHEKSGLYPMSGHATPVEAADNWLANRVDHAIEKHLSEMFRLGCEGDVDVRLGGRNVASFDRRWLEVHMPSVLSVDGVSHRHVDVRGIDWMLEQAGHNHPLPAASHRALDDLQGDVQWYGEAFDLIQAKS